VIYQTPWGNIPQVKSLVVIHTAVRTWNLNYNLFSYAPRMSIICHYSKLTARTPPDVREMSPDNGVWTQDASIIRHHALSLSGTKQSAASYAFRVDSSHTDRKLRRRVIRKVQRCLLRSLHDELTRTTYWSSQASLFITFQPENQRTNFYERYTTTGHLKTRAF
jgi:hypothetical protein